MAKDLANPPEIRIVRKPNRVAKHLASNSRELAITELEQGLICAAEAFYRFYGSLSGRRGRAHKLSGQDNVILQQIMAASRPLSVTDIARFANRDDTANIQYSLKKLLRAGLIRKTPNSSAREASYGATEQAREWTEHFIALRRELFTDPSAQILDFQEQLATCAKLLNTLAGFYDHGTRVNASREQVAPAALVEEAGKGGSVARRPDRKIHDGNSVIN
jgi:predicted MarR family transcription regulator